jgi:hypothetical protein
MPWDWHPANICCSSSTPPHPALLLLHVHACGTDNTCSSAAKVRLHVFQLFSLLQGLQGGMLLLLLLRLAAAQAAAAPRLAAVCCGSFKL